MDDHGRVIQDMRISLTDRCNFRCLYCLPETEEAANFYRTRWTPKPGAPAGPVPTESPIPIQYQWKPKAHLLTYEEIHRVVRIVSSLGIHKIRLTGGEPLLRRDVPSLVRLLSPVPGITDLALTTNGFLFQPHAGALREAGLHRVSFSLDSLDPDNFRRMTGRDGLQQVLDGIRQARSLGFHPVKVNAVVIRGLNDHEVPDLARFALREDLSMRFIEFMPLDSKRAWQKDLVVPGREVLERIRSVLPLDPVPAASHPSETARRWRFAGSATRAEIGIIAPVTEPFCGHCNRLRLTADGQVRTCLFSITEHDLRSLLRNGTTDDGIRDWLREVVRGKEKGHRIGHSDFIQPSRSMSCIGG
jgi:cyclic pyranopterin phosphate synthase